MAVQDSALNLAAAGVTGSVTDLSLHSADGGTTGADELTGGSYARVAPSYDAPAAGTAALSGPVTFDGPGSLTTVTHVGFWDSTTWLGSAPLTESRGVGPGDTLSLTAAPVKVS